MRFGRPAALPSVPTIRLRINGTDRSVPAADTRILLDLIREDLGLVGTKRGCDLGTCGCCTVLVDGRPSLSCLVLARAVDGRSITTIEGLTPPKGLSPIQRAFVEHGATQCGFCTPGIIVAATAFLERVPRPTEDQVREAVSGNLCRCTGYAKIVEAILAAAERP